MNMLSPTWITGEVCTIFTASETVIEGRTKDIEMQQWKRKLKHLTTLRNFKFTIME